MVVVFVVLIYFLLVIYRVIMYISESEAVFYRTKTLSSGEDVDRQPSSSALFTSADRWSSSITAGSASVTCQSPAPSPLHSTTTNCLKPGSGHNTTCTLKESLDTGLRSSFDFKLRGKWPEVYAGSPCFIKSVEPSC